jgi:hypothetical protein
MDYMPHDDVSIFHMSSFICSHSPEHEFAPCVALGPRTRLRRRYHRLLSSSRRRGSPGEMRRLAAPSFLSSLVFSVGSCMRSKILGSGVPAVSSVRDRRSLNCQSNGLFETGLAKRPPDGCSQDPTNASCTTLLGATRATVDARRDQASNMRYLGHMPAFVGWRQSRSVPTEFCCGSASQRGSSRRHAGTAFFEAPCRSESLLQR